MKDCENNNRVFILDHFYIKSSATYNIKTEAVH
jgi:hypothetical protein